MALSGTLKITAIWCSSPCVTRGTSPSPCLLWACSIAPSAGKNLLHTIPHALFFVMLSCIKNNSHTTVVCGALCVVWFAHVWRGLLRWRWDFWSPGKGIQSQRMRCFEELCCTHSLKSYLNQGHDVCCSKRRTWFLDALYISTSALFNQLTTSVSLTHH